MSITVEGIDELKDKLAVLGRQVREESIAGAFEGGLVIQGKAQRNTPVEYGNLRGSAYTQRTRRGAQVGYASAYALFVHENMEQKLQGQPRPSGLGTYWNPGGPKFLERAVSESLPDLLRLVERRLTQVLRS